MKIMFYPNIREYPVSEAGRHLWIFRGSQSQMWTTPTLVDQILMPELAPMRTCWWSYGLNLETLVGYSPEMKHDMSKTEEKDFALWLEEAQGWTRSASEEYLHCEIFYVHKKLSFMYRSASKRMTIEWYLLNSMTWLVKLKYQLSDIC